MPDVQNVHSFRAKERVCPADPPAEDHHADGDQALPCSPRLPCRALWPEALGEVLEGLSPGRTKLILSLPQMSTSCVAALLCDRGLFAWNPVGFTVARRGARGRCPSSTSKRILSPPLLGQCVLRRVGGRRQVKVDTHIEAFLFIIGGARVGD